MNVLILYALYEKKPRKTIEDSLYCFSRYDRKNRYYYLNILDSFSVADIVACETEIEKISLLIIHYSAIAMRYDPNWWKKHYASILRLLKRFKCPKIIIPQDEYNYTADLQRIISEANIDVILTCAYAEDYETLYPKSLGYKNIQTVYTGYVDEDTLHKIQSKKRIERIFDIGYRARALPYWLGRHAQLKIELANRFRKYLRLHKNGLICDIRNTTASAVSNGVILGDGWIDFLLQCRTMLGCLGGSGLIDYDGTLKNKVDKYMAEHPYASFDQCEVDCFPGKDNEIHLFALSPRHFECAMTKTCQLLVEGNYDGVFVAGRDYIEIKKDFSNIADVLEKVKDREYCERIANQCYENIVASGLYTYKMFVKKVLGSVVVKDFGNDYLRNISAFSRMSHIEATGDYGLLDYKLIQAGGVDAIKRWLGKDYFWNRTKGFFIGLHSIPRRIYYRKLEISRDRVN